MQIDLQEAVKTAERLVDELRRLDGTVHDKAPTRAAHRQRVELSRTLLYLAHLADRARVQVMDAYFAYKEGATMNDETADLLFDVVARLERNIQERDCPAIVALDGERKLVLTDYDYLRDDATAEAFERRAAAKAQEIAATRWSSPSRRSG